MATRLDRLWVLLECGSTPVTRKAAAQQIGDIQKLHPHELHNLLRKVCQYLSSKTWDSRVAAAQAVEAIVKNVKSWDPTFTPKDETADQPTDTPTSNGHNDQLSFETFDITQVLKYGTPLLSSTGDEYNQLDNDPEYQKMTQKEKASYHRQQLKQKLGLVSQGKVFSTGLEQLFDDNDLLTTFKKQDKPVKQSNVEVHELSVLSGLSARERNRAKRKVKMASRKINREKEKTADCDSDVNSPNSKRLKTSSVMVEQSEGSDKVVIDQVTDADAFFDDSDEWPFAWFCEYMFQQLFNPQWESRHGAASALREVIKYHGNTAGISSNTPIDQRVKVNQDWLSDAVIRLLCVFALDRFADFVSDQVVAPVRATCAQVFGIICKELSNDRLYKLVNVLLILSEQELWEVRHSTLMALQHLLAIRLDLSVQLLPLVGDCIVRGLQDSDDDVRAVAARALLPVTDHLHTSFNLVQLVQILWDSLLHLDDLSSSTGAIMDLLSSLLTNLPKYQSNNDQLSLLMSDASLSSLIPRLYPFLSHGIDTVRGSCLNTINNLIINGGDKSSAWLGIVLDELLNKLFIRLVLEGDSNIGNLTYQVWERVISLTDDTQLLTVLTSHLMQWLSILVTPSTVCIDPSLLFGITQEVCLGGCVGVESVQVKEQSAFNARVTGVRGIGLLSSHIPSSSHSLLSTTILQLLSSNSCIYKIIGSLLITYWTNAPTNLDIVTSLTSSLTEYCVYDEVAPFMTSLQKDCYVLVNGLEKKGIEGSGGLNPSLYTVEFAVQLATVTFKKGLETLTLTDDGKQELESFHRNLLTSIGQYQEYHQSLQLRLQCCVAGSLISLSSLPHKLNPIIRPLMDSIKTINDNLLQSLSSQWLSRLLDLSHDRSPSPNAKIIKNLSGYLCCDASHTPPVKPVETNGRSQEESGHTSHKKGGGGHVSWTAFDGIISLQKNNKVAKSGRTKRGPGRPPVIIRDAMAVTDNITLKEQQELLSIQKNGGEVAFTSLVRHFGSELFVKLPQLWTMINDTLLNVPSGTVTDVLTDDDAKTVQNVIHSLQVLETISPVITNNDIKEKLFSLLPVLLSCMTSSFTAVRHMGSRCVASLASLSIHRVMLYFMDNILPYLGDTRSNTNRQGAIEVIACFLETLDIDILWYVVLLVMPVLGRMSDQDNSVRLMASQCFARLVALMPLESGVADPPDISSLLIEKRNKERKFLEQLLNPTKLDNYKVPIPIKADLRKYQQDGINWLAFMNKYQVHGILCDDMGLGKTLQSICIIAGDHYDRKKQFEATGHPDCAPLPSIVVCPPTLTGHWFYEIKKFCDLEYLNPIQYSGPPAVRGRLQKVIVNDYDLVIVSYDIIRNDIDFFSTIHWNYCVLDEGHIIKNTKTKVTKAVKMLQANHRVILSGTPIQNNVLELWSLFDFLMPGFLGTEQQFNERYGHPILLSRDAKSSSKEQEAGALAMESLHRQVLPFLLRRMKEDVLQDLPPKIIQDYYCDLSPLQVLLYEDFAQSRAKQNVEDIITEDNENETAPPEKKKKKTTSPPQGHVFQALQYLRKVCNHPLLVVNKDHPLYDTVMDTLDSTTLHDISHSAKLLALKQLLNECGIGVHSESESSSEACISGGGAVVSQHRVLLFCQYKTMLDIIEKDLLKVHMPLVTYLRLDGSVPPNDRHGLVHRFNIDPSIDLLLLTTHVGGLGLNLTGADTVIFFEHDWNPTKDLQAMDRAHRIGQKRVVNVYRLITRGTLEEKIMSLQKFKLNIANTVVTQENNSLLSMNTSDFLDLFQLGGGGGEGKGLETTAGSGLKSVLDNLPDLWDDDQYHNEYNMESFMDSLKTGPNQ